MDGKNNSLNEYFNQYLQLIQRLSIKDEITIRKDSNIRISLYKSLISDRNVDFGEVMLVKNDGSKEELYEEKKSFLILSKYLQENPDFKFESKEMNYFSKNNKKRFQVFSTNMKQVLEAGLQVPILEEKNLDKKESEREVCRVLTYNSNMQNFKLLEKEKETILSIRDAIPAVFNYIYQRNKARDFKSKNDLESLNNMPKAYLQKAKFDEIKSLLESKEI